MVYDVAPWELELSSVGMTTASAVDVTLGQNASLHLRKPYKRWVGFEEEERSPFEAK